MLILVKPLPTLHDHIMCRKLLGRKLLLLEGHVVLLTLATYACVEYHRTAVALALGTKTSLYHSGISTALSSIQILHSCMCTESILHVYITMHPSMSACPNLPMTKLMVYCKCCSFEVGIKIFVVSLTAESTSFL